MDKIHEVTERNSTLYYCSECQQNVLLGDARYQCSPLCRYRACDFCGKVAVCDELSVATLYMRWVLLNEDGTPKETYVKREGV